MERGGVRRSDSTVKVSETSFLESDNHGGSEKDFGTDGYSGSWLFRLQWEPAESDPRTQPASVNYMNINRDQSAGACRLVS